MLTLTIEGRELFDEKTNSFESIDTTVVNLEHSLISLSKWESKHQKPFLGSNEKTSEELFDYIKFMVVDKHVDPNIMYKCSDRDLDLIRDYIDSNQSATTFGAMPERQGPSEVITSELIYYWLVAFNIPFECETWHLNRLFSLIRICNIKNSNPKKLSKHQIASRNRELNAKRKAELGTNG